MILGAFLEAESVFWSCWWGSFAKDEFGVSFGLDFEVFGRRMEAKGEKVSFHRPWQCFWAAEGEKVFRK